MSRAFLTLGEPFSALSHPLTSIPPTGPTHDDITYSSIAKAFSKNLEYHEETKRRMNLLAKKRPNPAEQTEEQKTARNRVSRWSEECVTVGHPCPPQMALFPIDSEVLFVQEDL